MGETKVVAADRIGLVLQIADTKLGADGVQVTLTAKALEVVKHAHEWTSWPKALHGTKGSAKLTREIPGTSGKQKIWWRIVAKFGKGAMQGAVQGAVQAARLLSRLRWRGLAKVLCRVLCRVCVGY